MDACVVLELFYDSLADGPDYFKMSITALSEK